jgi:hypothetical protein
LRESRGYQRTSFPASAGLAAPLSSGVFAFLGLGFSRIVATRHGRESPESKLKMPQALIQVENFVRWREKAGFYRADIARLHRAQASLPARTR